MVLGAKSESSEPEAAFDEMWDDVELVGEAEWWDGGGGFAVGAVVV